jgi:hypothetical protein
LSSDLEYGTKEDIVQGKNLKLNKPYPTKSQALSKPRRSLEYMCEKSVMGV